MNIPLFSKVFILLLPSGRFGLGGGGKYASPPFLSPFNHFFSPTCHLAIFLKSEKYTPLQKCALRCSQPLSGINGRSPEDEAYINCILESNPAANYLYIVDTRPKINAMYNRSVMYHLPPSHKNTYYAYTILSVHIVFL